MPPIRTSPEAGAKEAGIRKKMRKGTHSCFECRRRKIRCVYSADNPSTCTECFARGSRCIDQEHADSGSIVDQRKNLRERVARLEAILDTLIDEKPDRNTVEALRSVGSGDSYSVTPHSEDTPTSPDIEPDTTAPLLSLFSNDVLQRSNTITSQRSNSLSMSTADGNSPRPNTFKVACNMSVPSVAEEATKDPSPAQLKTSRARQALLSVLPPYEKLISCLKNNDKWWIIFGRKCPGTRGNAALDEFAQRVYTQGTVCELGTLVLSYGMNAEGDTPDQCLAAVDRWVISDDECMGTLEGLECAVFQAKMYADFGQARRSWLTCRRAVSFAQLMGLHRNHVASPERDSIWWTLFGTDRLTSLMLGMPYAIPDAHVNMEFRGQRLDENFSKEAYLARLAVFAGKVIDRNQGFQETSYAAAMDLDQELNTYAQALGCSWWELEALSPAAESASQVDWQEKLLANLCFHQTKVYLHMPFMLKSTETVGYEYSRNTCFSAAREMLRLYHLLRAPTTPLYECKAIDFIGFTAAVIIMLGLLGYGRLSQHDSEQDESDWRLIDISMEIFKRASNERGGKVAQQSYQALATLSQVRDYDCVGPETDPNCHTKIAIPFFGTISVQRGKSFKHLASHSYTSDSSSSKNTPGSSTCGGPLTPSTTASSSLDPMAVHNPQQQKQFPPAGEADVNIDPYIAYDGLYLPPSNANNNQQTQPDFNTAQHTNSLATSWPVASGFLWENVGNMDIDQDWSWYMNDPSLQSAPGFGRAF